MPDTSFKNSNEPSNKPQGTSYSLKRVSDCTLLIMANE